MRVAEIPGSPSARPWPWRFSDGGLPPRVGPGANRVRLLQDGGSTFSRMREAIRGARRSVLLEMYCFASDPVGRSFARELAARAAAGVDVFVLYDAAGSRTTPRDFFGWMRLRGVKVFENYPLRRFLKGLPLKWCDHRKLLVVDGAVAFVGGINLSRHYAPFEEGGLGWRDTELEIQGPIAKDLANEFLEHWSRHSGKSAPLVVPLSDWPEAGDTVGARARILSTPGQGNERTFQRFFCSLLAHARKRIWIANPYFLPPLSLRRALRRAARRGVDVRLLMPRTSDVPPVLFATQHYYARYLRWGVRLFEWMGPMMHAKVSVVDGRWSTIGSSNLDAQSLRWNSELNVTLESPELGGLLERMFEEDFARAHEVRRDEWSRRSHLRRALEGFFSLFRVIL